MKRKIYSQLLHWKKTEQGKVALLIDGARRVGKSYIVEEFARNEYKSYIFIDFNRAGRDIHELFADGLSDLNSLFLYLQNIMGVRLYERESLIVFDEVQLCPRAFALALALVEGVAHRVNATNPYCLGVARSPSGQCEVFRCRRASVRQDSVVL